MPAAKPLTKEINFYLEQLNTEQKQAVLGVVKTFAKEDERWNEKEYMAEMNRRFTEMETGNVKPLSLNELEAGARKAFKKESAKKG